MEFKNNVFIITGGASGLGAATARMIVENGGKVVLADVQVEAGEKLAAELKGKFVKCDVTSEADGLAVVAAAESMGKLVGLINCAGVAPAVKTVGKDGAHPLDVFQRVVNINLVGTFNMSRLAAAAMSNQEPNAAGERGVIINTASVAAYDGQIGQAAYGASKAGVVGLTLPMARDLSRNGVRVMTIAPGIFETAEAFREVRPVFEGLELGLGVRVVIAGVWSAVRLGHAQVGQEYGDRFGRHGRPTIRMDRQAALLDALHWLALDPVEAQALDGFALVAGFEDVAFQFGQFILERTHDREEVVERLAKQPLAGAGLQIAHADVVVHDVNRAVLG